MSLGLAPEERLVSSRSIDPESYEQFLRARPLVRARSTGVPQAIRILEPVAARNPDYAPAWALLASSYSTMPGYVDGSERRRRIAEFWPKAEAAARRAIQLDPNLADAYFALGRLQRARGKLVEADDLFSKALELDPNNPDALGVYMLLLANVGRLKDALAVTQQLRALEPYVPTFNEDAAQIFWETGQNDTAIKIRKSLMERPTGPPGLAMMYASMGRYTEAAEVLETAVRTGSNRPQYIAVQLQQLHSAAGLLRTAPAKAVLPQSPPRLGGLGWVYLYVGAPERALDEYEDMIKSGLVGGVGGSFGFLWHSSYARCARRSASRPSCARPASPITGASAAGRIYAAPWARTISSAIEVTAPKFKDCGMSASSEYRSLPIYTANDRNALTRALLSGHWQENRLEAAAAVECGIEQAIAAGSPDHVDSRSVFQERQMGRSVRHPQPRSARNSTLDNYINICINR